VREAPPLGEGRGRPRSRSEAEMQHYSRGLIVIAAGVAVAVMLAAMPVAARSYRPAVSCEVSDFSMMLRLYMPLVRDGSGSPDEKGMEGSLEIRHQKVPKERRFWT